MNSFDPLLRVNAFGEGVIKEIHHHIIEWISSSSFQNLVKVFGWEDDVLLGLEQRIEKLELQSVEWDFRRRTSRQESIGIVANEATRWTSNERHLTSIQIETALAAAKALHLSEASVPRSNRYHSILVLGGARLSCLLRTRRAAEFLQQGIHAREVVLLGSERPIASSERDATNTYAPSAQTEFDLFIASGSTTFDLGKVNNAERHTSGKPHESWEIREYHSSFVERVIILSAPSSEPDRRRANSADTYRFYLEHYPVDPGEKFLLVTSQIYVPYQQLEALRVLSVQSDIVVETVGFPPEWGRDLQGMQGPQHYLQEIRSFLQSARRFIKAYPMECR